MRRVLSVVAFAGALALLGLCSCSRWAGRTRNAETQSAEQFDETNPLGANAACYICHMTFVKETLGKTHLKAKITCIRCHGVSAPHANDEDIGATKPDVTFKRNRVDAMCLKCHKKHKVEAAKKDHVCTDCHGTHRIARANTQKE